MKKFLFLSSACAALVASVMLPSCVEKLGDDCNNTRTCTDTSSGGSGTGGVAGSSSGGAGEGGSTGGQASACTEECTAPKGVCDEDAKKCVGCLVDDDCKEGGATLCDAASKTCVECLAATDCTDVTKAACLDGECSSCAQDADCARLSETPVCDEPSGSCVACTKDKEEELCGEFSCSSLTHTCTETKRGIRDVCDPCESDSECATGRRCVQQVFGSTEVGHFCFFDQAQGGCGDTVPARKPYRTKLEATSIDEVPGTFCLPPTSTTCQGIRDTQSKTCSQDTDCGVADVDDGYCPSVGSGAGFCSYGCNGDLDCKGTLTCGGSPEHCRP